jgi:RecB family endonuclease NucS
MSEFAGTVSHVRLIVARCEVRYTGRLTAVLPESTRLLIFKSDGSVLVHADAGGYKPLNSAG